MFTVGSGDPNVFCIAAHPSERHFLGIQAAPMIGVDPNSVPIKGGGRVKNFVAPGAKAKTTREATVHNDSPEVARPEAAIRSLTHAMTSLSSHAQARSLSLIGLGNRFCLTNPYRWLRPSPVNARTSPSRKSLRDSIRRSKLQERP